MADTRVVIDVDINTSSAASALRSLQSQINSFTGALNKNNTEQALASRGITRQLMDLVNTSKYFTAEMVRMQTGATQLDKTLSKGQVTMGQFFSAKFKKDGLEAARVLSLAHARAQSLQTQFVATSGAANGFRDAIAIRPLAAFNDAAAVSAQKLIIQRAMLQQATTSMINFGKNTQWAGRQLMVGFTIPLTIFAATAGKTFMDLEKQSLAFRKVYGDAFTTPEELNKNIEAVKKLSTEFTKYGIAVADTMELAAQAAAAGAKNADLIDATTEATRLATLGQLDLQAAMETTISLQSAFGLSGDKLTKSINFMNMVENQTVLTLQDLTDAIPRVAPVIQGLGGTVEDMAIMLTAMKEGGISAAQGANALKSGLASLINPTDRAIEKLQTMGINLNAIVKANRGDLMGTVQDFARALATLDEFGRQQALETVFGKFQYARLGALFNNIIRDGSQASRAMDAAAMSAGNLAAAANKELKMIEESPAIKFTAAMERLKLAIAPIGEMFVKMATPIINFLATIADKFNNLPDFAKKFIAFGTVLVGIVIPAGTMFLGLLMNLIGTLTKFGHLATIFIKGFAQGGIKQALDNVSQATKYMSLAEMDATNAAKQLSGATKSVNAALLEQVAPTEAATSAISGLAGAYDVLTRNMREAQLVGGISMQVPGAAMRNAAGRSSSIVGRPLPIVRRNRGGSIPYMSTGSTVPGVGNTDTVPAMLTPGEFVVNKQATQQNIGLLHAINNGDVQYRNKGGGIAQAGRSFYGIPPANSAAAVARLQQFQESRQALANIWGLPATSSARSRAVSQTATVRSGAKSRDIYNILSLRDTEQSNLLKTAVKLGLTPEELGLKAHGNLVVGMSKKSNDEMRDGTLLRSSLISELSNSAYSPIEQQIQKYFGKPLNYSLFDFIYREEISKLPRRGINNKLFEKATRNALRKYMSDPLTNFSRDQRRSFLRDILAGDTVRGNAKISDIRRVLNAKNIPFDEQGSNLYATVDGKTYNFGNLLGRKVGNLGAPEGIIRYDKLEVGAEQQRLHANKGGMIPGIQYLQTGARVAAMSKSLIKQMISGITTDGRSSPYAYKILKSSLGTEIDSRILMDAQKLGGYDKKPIMPDWYSRIATAHIRPEKRGFKKLWRARNIRFTSAAENHIMNQVFPNASKEKKELLSDIARKNKLTKFYKSLLNGNHPTTMDEYRKLDILLSELRKDKRFKDVFNNEFDDADTALLSGLAKFRYDKSKKTQWYISQYEDPFNLVKGRAQTARTIISNMNMGGQVPGIRGYMAGSRVDPVLSMLQRRRAQVAVARGKSLDDIIFSRGSDNKLNADPSDILTMLLHNKNIGNRDLENISKYHGNRIKDGIFGKFDKELGYKTRDQKASTWKQIANILDERGYPVIQRKNMGGQILGGTVNKNKNFYGRFNAKTVELFTKWVSSQPSAISEMKIGVAKDAALAQMFKGGFRKSGQAETLERATWMENIPKLGSTIPLGSLASFSPKGTPVAQHLMDSQLRKDYESAMMFLKMDQRGQKDDAYFLRKVMDAGPDNIPSWSPEHRYISPITKKKGIDAWVQDTITFMSERQAKIKKNKEIIRNYNRMIPTIIELDTPKGTIRANIDDIVALQNQKFMGRQTTEQERILHNAMIKVLGIEEEGNLKRIRAKLISSEYPGFNSGGVIPKMQYFGANMLQRIVQPMVAAKTAAQQQEFLTLYSGGNFEKGFALNPIKTRANTTNLHGPGVYTTEAKNMAETYVVNRGNNDRHLYEMKIGKGTRKFLDLDQEYIDAPTFKIEMAMEKVLKKHGMTYEDVMPLRTGSMTVAQWRESITENIASKLKARGMNRDDAEWEGQMVFVNAARESGISGLTHVGGKLMGKNEQLHRVYILYDKPDSMLRLNQGGFLSPTLKANRGNIVPGTGNTDTVPAMLTPGEFVVNKRATQSNMTLLHAINNGKVAGYVAGGEVVEQRAGGIGRGSSIQYVVKGGGGQIIGSYSTKEEAKAALSNYRKQVQSRVKDIKKAGGGGMRGGMMKGMGSSMALGMGGMGVMMAGQKMEMDAAQQGQTSAMGGMLSTAGIGLSMASILPMIPGITSPVGIAAVGIAAAGAAVGVAMYKFRDNIDTTARKMADLGSNVGGTANALNTMANLLGQQTPAQRQAQLQIGLGAEEQQAFMSEFSAIFESEAGAKFIEDLKSATSADRFIQLSQYLQSAIAAGMMDKTQAEAFAKTIGAILGDPTLAAKTATSIKESKSGSTALLDIARTREEDVALSDAIIETKKQETVSYENSSAAIGSSLQVIQDFSNAQALAYEEFAKGTISYEEYNKVIDESRKKQGEYTQVIQDSITKTTDFGATMQALKDQAVAILGEQGYADLENIITTTATEQANIQVYGQKEGPNPFQWFVENIVKPPKFTIPSEPVGGEQIKQISIEEQKAKTLPIAAAAAVAGLNPKLAGEFAADILKGKGVKAETYKKLEGTLGPKAAAESAILIDEIQSGKFIGGRTAGRAGGSLISPKDESARLAQIASDFITKAKGDPAALSAYISSYAEKEQATRLKDFGMLTGKQQVRKVADAGALSQIYGSRIQQTLQDTAAYQTALEQDKTLQFQPTLQRAKEAGVTEQVINYAINATENGQPVDMVSKISDLTQATKDIQSLPEEMIIGLGIDIKNVKDLEKFGPMAQQLIKNWELIQNLNPNINMTAAMEFLTIDENGNPLSTKEVTDRVAKLNIAWKNLSSSKASVRKQAEIDIATAYAGNVIGGDPVEMAKNAMDDLRDQFKNFDKFDPVTRDLLIQTTIKYDVRGVQLALDIEAALKAVENAKTTEGREQALKILNGLRAEQSALEGERKGALKGIASNADITTGGGGGGGGGEKPLLKQLQEELKALQNIGIGFAKNLEKNKGIFKGIIAGPFGEEFINYLISQGDKGIKILKEKGAKFNQAYQTFVKIQLQKAKNFALQLPSIFNQQKLDLTGQTLVSKRLEGQGFSQANIETIMQGLPEGFLASYAMAKAIKPKKRTKREQSIIDYFNKQNMADALKPAKQLNNKMQEQFITGKEDALTLETTLADALSGKNISPEVIDMLIEMGWTSAQVEDNLGKVVKQAQRLDEVIKTSAYKDSMQGMTDETNQLNQSLTLMKQGIAPDAAAAISQIAGSAQWSTEQLNNFTQSFENLKVLRLAAQGREAVQEQILASNEKIRQLEYEKDLIESINADTNMAALYVKEGVTNHEDLLEVYERQEKIKSRELELEQRKLEPIDDQIKILEESIQTTEEFYNAQLENLDKIITREEEIFALRQKTLGLADALSRGDVASAAQAALEIEKERAAQRSSDQKSLIEKQRQEAISTIEANITTQKDKRKVIEDEILRIQKEQRSIADQIYNVNFIISEQAARLEDYYQLGNNKLIELTASLASARKEAELLAKAALAVGEIKTPNAQPISTPTTPVPTPTPSVPAAPKPMILPGFGIVAVPSAPTQAAPKPYEVPGYWSGVFGLTRRANGGMISYKGSKEPPPGFGMGGTVKYFANGGYSFGSDTVPAMLTPGEFVVRSSMAEAYKPLLESINSNVFPRVNMNKAMPSSSTQNSGSMYNYNVNVTLNGSDMDPDDVANVVMQKIKMKDSMNIRSYNYRG